MELTTLYGFSYSSFEPLRHPSNLSFRVSVDTYSNIFIVKFYTYSYALQWAGNLSENRRLRMSLYQTQDRKFRTKKPYKTEVEGKKRGRKKWKKKCSHRGEKKEK